ncbi:Gfo/Idh/MocA family protein [Tateyamaria sp. SN6-1]|uniref:Gfo/Idh/MocA family protein n=1 Tax=Tateyamaria sp. SN6-1 TaxID=3092148 RepID=UPI0039F5A229
MHGIGIIGCGNISAAYLRLAPLFKGIEMRAVADLNLEAAEARAAEFGVRACTVEDLLAAGDIDIVVNLTIPAAHYDVSRQILEAGKHVYTEKPLVLTLEEAEALRGLAATNGLRIGSAPDTFLGGAHQAARAALDAGRIGKVVTGTAHVMSHGMEDWHPNPDFFFLPGAGPMLDLGPYYVTNLIQLLGPVRRVSALTSMGQSTRTIGSAARKGEEIPVKTPTTLHALLDFASGASITLSTSWDVWAHRHSHMELYGLEGTMYLPDPNWFSGTVEVTDRTGTPQALDQADHPFSVPNDDMGGTPMANYRMAGLVDMAIAMAEDRPHRCGLDLAVHAVDVMTSVLRAGETGTVIDLATTCDRPAPMDAAAARAMLK